MINPTDEDINEALQLLNYLSMEIYNADEVAVLAKTIAQLRVAMEALDKIAIVARSPVTMQETARRALHQIRSNTDERFD